MDKIQLDLHSKQLEKKVFCLGLSRTGTTSLGDALETLGMRRLTWSRPASLEYFRAFESGDFQALFEVAYRFDALEDMPWPFVYRALDDHFPNAKFVLTRRRDTAVWAQSIHRQTLGKPRHRMRPYSVVFGHHFFHENPRAFVEVYERHNSDVVAHFAAKYPNGLHPVPKTPS